MSGIMKMSSSLVKNDALNQLHFTFKGKLCICCAVWLTVLLRIIAMGYYNGFGITTDICANLSFFLLKVCLVLFISWWPLKLRLQTQVLGNGRILLIAFDKCK